MPHVFSLSLADYAVIAAYMLAMVAIGFRVGQKQKSTADFFLAGRNMTWWPVALSLFAALFSAISYVAMPGEAFNYGMNMSLMAPLSLLPIPIVVFVFLRLFYKLRLWTAYEYLERRFDVRVRLVGSLAFLLLRSFYLGVVLYAAALVIQPITGWSLTTSALIIGLGSTLYIAVGGSEAVIWTDVVQTFILLGGIVVVIGIVAAETTGGIFGIWNQAAAMGRGFDISAKSGIWNWDFSQRITVWAWLIGLLPGCIGPATDQVNLQRCLSTKSLKAAGWAMVGSGILSVIVTYLFYFAGLAVLVFFAVLHPNVLPAGTRGDSAFTYFISHNLPTGLRGLLIAAILAAVMSTLASVVNSLVMVSVKDIYERMIHKGHSEAHYVKISKGLTWLWGLIPIVLSLTIDSLFTGRNIPLLEISNVTLSFFGSVMLGIFILGLLTYRATATGAIVGLIAGSVLSAWITWRYYLSPVRDAERLSFLWLGLIGISSVVLLGYITSWLTPGTDRSRIRDYVIWSQWHRRRTRLASIATSSDEAPLVGACESDGTSAKSLVKVPASPNPES